MPQSTHLDEIGRFAECQAILGYRFGKLTLLQEALTHASGAEHRRASNERLEFLGDAILGAIVSEMLFQRFPNYLEGDLTKIKSIVVSRRTCAKISSRLRLNQFLVMGKGMGSHAQTPPSVLADVFESLIGAIYLDGGIEAARALIGRLLSPEIDAAVDGHGGLNYKSNLQQVAQREYGETPTYLLMDEKGPDHSKCFQVSARIGERRFASAWGPTKKEAEQRAALNALCQLAGEPLPYESDF
jgi:ribonuclease-3